MVLSGDNHAYERLAPMTPDRRARRGDGIRQFVVGTGGRSHYRFSDGAIHPNTETGDDQTYGVLKLTLGAGRLCVGVPAGSRQVVHGHGRPRTCH